MRLEERNKTALAVTWIIRATKRTATTSIEVDIRDTFLIKRADLKRVLEKNVRLFHRVELLLNFMTAPPL